jgi:hypothetical protein
MTRAEIRIEAAKKRLAATESALSRAYEAKVEAVSAASKRYSQQIWKAEKLLLKARAELSHAELAAQGIIPMQTIIRWRGKRYAVRIDRRGWAETVPVTAAGRIHKARHPEHMPRRMDEVTILPDEVKE